MHKFMFLLSLLAVSAGLLFAQTGAGSIAGTVMDPSGAVVPSAVVRVTNTATGVTAELTTNESGIYQALQLIPGPYTVTVGAAGFKSMERKGITVQVGDRLTLNVTLEVGTAVDTVTVEGQVAQLRTEDAQTGEVITSKQIETLAQVQRDPLQLVALSGNIQGGGVFGGDRAQGGEPAGDDFARNNNTRINGGRTGGIEYLVDGITAGSGRSHGVADQTLTPSMDDTAEFRVITNGISAQYGRISGGAVEVVTKSGTNELHGQGFEYFRNDMLNAAAWQQNASNVPKTPYHQNDFGFTVGGPVVLPKIYNGRNRTFFYGNYEGIRFRQSGSVVIGTVPTEAELNGDFSQTRNNGVAPIMYDQIGPLVQVMRNATLTWKRTQVINDGVHLPASMIDPAFTALAKYLPKPNRVGNPDVTDYMNYQGKQNTIRNSNAWSIRLDHNITDRQRIYGRFGAGSSDYAQTRWLSDETTAPGNRVKNGRSGSVTYDWTISPTLTLSARGGVYHNPFSTGNLYKAGFNTDDIPLDSVTKSILGSESLPYICVNFQSDCGLNNGVQGGVWLGGSLDGQPDFSVANSTTYQGNVTIAKVLGRHTLQTGFEHRRYYDNYWNGGSGQFIIFSSALQEWPNDESSNPTGWSLGLAAAEEGHGNFYRASGPNTRALAMNYYAAFLQDDFRVSSKLTLNLGMRWDMESPTTERHDKLYFWDPKSRHFNVDAGYSWTQALAEAGLPSTLPTPYWVNNGFESGAIRIANTPEWKKRGATTPNPHQFAPRVGMAYQLDPKTVFRGSFGLMYISTTGDTGAYRAINSTMNLSDSANNGWNESDDNMLHMLSSWRNPYARPTDIRQYVRDNATVNYQSAGDAAAISADQKQPYEITWSAGIQRELPGKFLVETYYTANRGVRLLGFDLVSHFPKEFDVPSQFGLWSTKVASPTASQTPTSNIVGAKQNLGWMYALYPYLGPFQLVNANIGRSSYNAWNTRVERRFSSGVSLLANYTYSRLLENVGGPESSYYGLSNGGRAVKLPQTVEPITATWGLSPSDQTHRLAIAYVVEIPIGRGKRLLNDPKGFSGTLLDYAVGGWEFAGNTLFRSGTPVTLGRKTSTDAGFNSSVKMSWKAGSNHQLSNPGFSGNNKSLLVYGADSRTGIANRFDLSQLELGPTPALTYGDTPYIFGLRNPSSNLTSLSLMKKFPIRGESKYLQLRLEAQNAFNQQPLSDYQSNPEQPDFGLITGKVAGSERIAQISARLVF